VSSEVDLRAVVAAPARGVLEHAIATYGAPADLSIAAQLERWAREKPDGVAIDDGSRVITWGELPRAAAAVAADITGASRVGVVAGPTIETLLVLYGCAQAGAVYCPVPVMFTPFELSKVFDSMNVDVAYVAPAFEQNLTEARWDADRLPRLVVDWTARADPPTPPVVDQEAPWWILWTSGSTAFPKAAVIPHRSPLLSGYAYAAALRTGPDDSWINFFPFFHSGGLCMIVMHALAAGCRLRLMPAGFEPGEAIRIIRDERITRCGGFDVFWNRMRAHPEWANADFSSVGACTMGGNLQMYDLLESLGIPLIVTAYASTEASLASATMPSESDRSMRMLANGTPTAGTDVIIVDPESGGRVRPGVPGEICVRGPLTFVGYDGSDVTEPDGIDGEGFFHSGDHGWIDEAGRVWFRGRYKMMVKSGGENISCKEVEIALETLVSEVRSAQVVGVPDAEWGEIAVAFVELDEDVPIDDESIRTRLRTQLAPFKIPKRFHVVERGQWPVTQTGKVRRDVLVDRATVAS
jgi:fatty-acyl-CoA synthase